MLKEFDSIKPNSKMYGILPGRGSLVDPGALNGIDRMLSESADMASHATIGL